MTLRHPVARLVAGAWLAGVLVVTTPAAAIDTLDWDSLRPAAACSHTPLLANQIVRIPAQDLTEAHRHGLQPLVLTGRIDVLEQESRLRFVDGELPFRSGYVVANPKIHTQQALAPLSARSGAPLP